MAICSEGHIHLDVYDWLTYRAVLKYTNATRGKLNSTRINLWVPLLLGNN